MNHRTAAPGAVALAAFALTFVAACGSEVAPPSQDLGGGTSSETSSSRPTGWPDCFNGSADAAARTCQGTATTPDDNPARLDFNDTGRG